MNGFARVLAVVLFGLLPAFGAEKPVVESKYAKARCRLWTSIPRRLFGAHPTQPTWRKIPLESPFLAIAPRSARAGPRTISTSSSSAPTSNCISSPLPTPIRKPTNSGTGTLRKYFSAQTLLISSATRNSKSLRRANGSISTSTLHNPHHEEGWTWNSGFEVLAKIDHAEAYLVRRHADPVPRHRHTAARARQYASHEFVPQRGSTGHAHEITWQPPMNKTFHVPERFGLIKLVQKGD